MRSAFVAALVLGCASAAFVPTTLPALRRGRQPAVCLRMSEQKPGEQVRMAFECRVRIAPIGANRSERAAGDP